MPTFTPAPWLPSAGAAACQVSAWAECTPSLVPCGSESVASLTRLTPGCAASMRSLAGRTATTVEPA